MRRAIALVLVLASCRKSEDAPKSGTPGGARKPRVTLVEVQAREIEYVVEAVGSIEASEEISIPARVAGVVDRVDFKEGDSVDEKKILLEIEVKKHRLGEERAKADHDRAAAQKNLAETLYTNRLKLYEEGRKQGKDWITNEQMATWLADLDKAKADLERARVDWELAKRNHADASVRPPIAGMINKKLVSKGEYVKAETVVATILNVATLYVRFTVPEMEAARIGRDREITFTLRSAPGTAFRAKIFHLAQKADESTRAVECKAEVLDKSDRLRAGYFASVRIVTAREKSVVIPERAVLPTERGFVVYVVDEKNVAVSRVVKLGLRVGGQVEVLDGLESGQKIVADGGGGLRDRTEVEPVAGAGP